MVPAKGWHDGLDAMTFIMIIRDFTGVGLADAKGFLDCVRAGEAVDLHPYQSGRSVALAEKPLRHSAIERAEVVDA